jgi:NACHT domain
MAFEYQDLIGIEVLLNFFRDPKLYRWVEIESEEPTAGYLDDVVAARGDGAFEYIQVKFTPDPDKYLLSWDWLLERKPAGTSRLRKWHETITSLGASGPIQKAELRTNRRPDEEFAKALKDNRVQFNDVATTTRASIEKQLGGTKEAQAFFKTFKFIHSEIPDVDGFENTLKGTIVPTDTTSDGWLLLRSQVRRWATHKNQPEPDGKIRHTHLVQIITKQRPKPIPQNFLVPKIYAVPRVGFHEAFVKRLTKGRASVSVLWGTPGRGKSTYLSFLIRELTKKKIPVIRHHYFLSLEDATIDRISFSDIANSLMSQMTSRYPEAIESKKELQDFPDKLREWIEACGVYYARKGKRFFVVVDGLDHVWRERMNIEQMDHLFNYLLPCPKNVVLIVGTQRVPAEQLPSRLLQRAEASSWIEIPAMDEHAVHDWIVGQHKAKRLRISGNASRLQGQRKEALDALSGAFYKISKGHPLYLIYSFESLVRRGVPITADEVKVLPRCPDGDIRKYYRILWSRLKPQGKKVLHLIAGSEFRWPPDGLRHCGGSLDEVDHLLEHRRTGVMPFHGSILAFAREEADHESTYKSLLPKIVRWLETGAPEFWRWGWLWISRAQLGKDTDILKKTTRQWVVDSLAAGWPDKQIVAILRDAENRAFEKNDYCRSIELRGFKTRVLNGPEFQTHHYPQFLESAIRAKGNTQQCLNMADDLGSLSDAEIVTLSRSLRADQQAEICAECVDELARRVNLWLALRHRRSDEFLTLVEQFFEVLTRHRKFEIKKVFNFLTQFNEADRLFNSLLDDLVETRNTEPLLQLLELLGTNKYTNWRALAEDATVRLAGLEGIDLRTRIFQSPPSVSPLLSCWLQFHGGYCPPLLNFTFEASLLIRDRHDYGPNIGLQKFFHSYFFGVLATYQSASGELSLILPGVDRSRIGWMRNALAALETLAKEIAKGSRRATFSAPFVAVSDIEPVSGRRTSEADSVQYWSLKSALRQIAIDLHLVEKFAGEETTIPLVELSSARATQHWDDIMWLSENVKNRMKLLEPSGAKIILNELSEKENRHITSFNDRIERWVELALFALLYDLAGVDNLVRRAANGLVAYGFHKDSYIYEVLGSIDQIQKAGSTKALTLLKKVAPIVEQISEFTDGDDVGSSREELIDLIASICPTKLPDCYAHHIEKDEWRLAEATLKAHMRLLNFQDDISLALAHTFLDREELLELDGLRKRGVAGAKEAFNAQETFLGGIAKSRERSYGSSSTDDVRNGSKPHDVSNYGPSQFKKLFEAVSDHKLGYEHRDAALASWLNYWKDRGKGATALKSIEVFFKSTERTYWAEGILDPAFAVSQSRLRKSAQDDRWSFCLTAGTLWPANQERPCRDDRAGTTHRPSRHRWRLLPSRAIERWPNSPSSSMCIPIRSQRGRRSLRAALPTYSVQAVRTGPRRLRST